MRPSVLADLHVSLAVLVHYSGSPSMPPDEPADPPDEPRAIDLVRRAGGERGAGDGDAELDPATIAQLAAWFGPAAPAAPLPGPEPISEERRAYLERLERVLAAIEPALLDRIFAVERAGDALLFMPPPLDAVRASLALFAPEVWRLPLAGPGDEEARELPVPEDLEHLGRAAVPQAVLRDLHRPELHFPRELSVAEIDADAAAERSRLRDQRIAAEVMRTRYYIQGFEPSAVAQVTAARADLDAILHGPWEKVEAVKMRALTDAEAVAAARWFGG